MSHAARVRAYYENNTRLFLRLGKDQGTQNIHQALWAEGITTQAEAVNYANQRVLSEVRRWGSLLSPGEPVSVLDLGCGVGSGLFFLDTHYDGPARFQGITISPTQAAIAQQRGKAVADSRVQVLEGDFLNLPETGPVHVAYAIEAFLHAADAARFFQQVGRRLVKGGRLLLIDDFLSPTGAKPGLSAEQQRWLDDFRAGWLAGSLLPVEEVSALAGLAGLKLVQDTDFTPLMALGRPRDRLIGSMMKVAGSLMRRSTYFQSLTGGYAKQQCLKQGLVQYRELVFEKGR
ncbi:MAG: class I SAM-dependent methyltransferase [Bacteroidetes bacterium]|nr:MAG: class I SAM-dependent methyltransferase [Bacteroidota bacterium]